MGHVKTPRAVNSGARPEDESDMTSISTTAQRDELAQAIAAAADGFRDLPPGRTPTTQDITAADAILAAGYRKPRTVTTVEELDALPDTSLVLDAGGDVSRRVLGGWTTTVLEADGGMWLTENVETAELPATVLWEPEA